MKKSIAPLATLLVVLLMTPAYSVAGTCSVKPKKGATSEELQALATVSKEWAQAMALGSIKSSANLEASAGELQVDAGCLVYAFSIRSPGKPILARVLVDAGTGNVLSRDRRPERAEQADHKDVATNPKPEPKEAAANPSLEAKGAAATPNPEPKDAAANPKPENKDGAAKPKPEHKAAAAKPKRVRKEAASSPKHEHKEAAANPAPTPALNP